jgi:CDP-diacylglycerol pyrophosphatase
MLVNVFSHRRTVLSLILIVILIAVGVLVFKWRANSNALWQIISRQCLPNQRASQHPEPCIKIDEIAGFTELDLLTLNFASPEEIQDHNCSVLTSK